MNMDKIVSLAKRRGFAYPGSEIYGGFANSYTYGPYGVELKKNIKDLWWKTFVQDRPDVVGIDGDIILHPKTWKASGHLDNFNDQMVDCKKCKTRVRADELIEEQCKIECEGLSNEDVKKLMQENNVTCPKCGAVDWTDVRQFNLMFSTQMAKTGEDDTAYLRPETAQAIFLEFKNIVNTMRVKLPFGIAQIGKAFRNEITPGNFIFRRLEFEQMEIEYFIFEDSWEKLFDQWLRDMKSWCELIGLKKVHEREHAKEKLSHYSKRTVDLEFDFPFGRKELYGLAYRTDFDLGQHETHSKKELRIHDEASGKKILPHVLEPTWGVDRTVLALLCDAYDEEKVEDGERVVLHLAPIIAPVKVAVMPLMKKDGMGEKAQEIFDLVKVFGNCELDDGGSIGKRYRRQDEIGTPVCVTVDYDTMGKSVETRHGVSLQDTVTIRDRDTMKQERVKIGELVEKLRKSFFDK
ncbi:glycine--tRNA ligase [Candidatus Gracilibacteria bacterium]|nr:glycine--tRNA ligase [Candidatus Gracilibacteria bacterium]